MNGLFNSYWNSIGLPLSRYKGELVENLGFSLVEVLTWVGLFFSLWLGFKIYKKIFPKKYFKLRQEKRSFRVTLSFLFLFFAGPVLLFMLASGQSAFPVNLTPTLLKKSLSKTFDPPPYTLDSFNINHSRYNSQLNLDFDSSLYIALSEDRIITLCDNALDDVLSKLKLPKGRPVKKIKTQKGLTRVLGLSYGGPAYHDPLTSEIALVSYEDMPTPKSWRIEAICHEIAHAKGFTREMDAEILSQLALYTSYHPTLNQIAKLMYLEKSGRPYDLPAYLELERKNATAALNLAKEKQYGVNILRKINKLIGIQINNNLYGNVNPDKEWDPKHPFFATVQMLYPKVSAE